ncbi:hypothetical protein LCGC14_1763840 [marine sediment metagenome]|uniref:Dipeptidylpeptidase IV N-terminal domain-containing protein n=1 Tax=marine sediment metagenome TaxID=412755 RepID=A0A0F9HMQ5_9ZZZZ
MSPDGRRLCWLAPSENDQPYAIKTYDLKADRTEELGIQWPGEEDITWGDCGWADGDTLVVWGYSVSSAVQWRRDTPKALHILRVNYKDRTVQREGSSRRFAKWRISPDCRYAFASGPEDGAQPGVHFLDLRTGRTQYIGGEERPAWTADARVALRISRFYGQEQWLCRFDVEKAAETPVLKIREDEELVAASPRGRFAILCDRTRGSLRPLSLVNVATGQRQRLPGSVLSSISLVWRHASVLGPWVSTFTPDGRKFMLWSPTPRQLFGLQLYSIPEGWLK